MRIIRVMEIEAGAKTIEPNRLDVSMSVYVDRRILDILDETDQERVKDLSHDLAEMLSEGVTEFITGKVANKSSKNTVDEFVKYIKNKATTNPDAADIYDILRGFRNEDK